MLIWMEYICLRNVSLPPFAQKSSSLPFLTIRNPVEVLRSRPRGWQGPTRILTDRVRTGGKATDINGHENDSGNRGDIERCGHGLRDTYHLFRWIRGDAGRKIRRES